MPKSRSQKTTSIHALADQLKAAKIAIIAQFARVSVKDSEALRKETRAAGVDLTVVKKTLFRRALEQAGLPTMLTESARGNILVAISTDDEVQAAKLLKAFMKGREAMSFVGGYLDGQALDASQVTALASLPTLQQLRGQFVGVLAAPLTGLVRTMQGPIQGLVTALSAIRDAKPAA